MKGSIHGHQVFPETAPKARQLKWERKIGHGPKHPNSGFGFQVIKRLVHEPEFKMEKERTQ